MARKTLQIDPFQDHHNHFLVVQRDYPNSVPGSSHAYATTMPAHRPYYLCQSVANRVAKVSSSNYSGHGKKLGPVLHQKVTCQDCITFPREQRMASPFQDHLTAKLPLSKTI